jgi:O-antigen/teichoic acid export membrane protein
VKHKIAIRWDLAAALFHFGGWMTVTNVVSPLMVSLDRFLIGAVVSISAVAYYATPSEAITRLLIIPSAIVGVLFPAFSSGFVQDKARTRLLFVRGVKYTFLAIFPFLLVLIVFAREGLTWWVGAEFAQHSAVVLQWLAIGVFFNGIAQIPFALVQGVGRPDITSKMHLVELPAYCILLWALVRTYGIEGAAMAWTVRVVVDAMILFGFSYRILRTEPQNLRGFALPITSALFLLTLGSVPMSIYVKVSFTAVTLFAFGFVTWFALLDPAERLYARNRIRAN